VTIIAEAPVASTLQQSSKPLLTRIDLGLCVGAVAFVWLVGWIVFDSWLTPLGTWLLSCSVASVLLSFTAWLLRRAAWLAVCLLAVLLAAALVLPAASRSSRVQIVNDSSDRLEMVIRDAGGKRVKRLHIEPNGKAEFLYFVGDGGRDIQATVAISNVSKGSTKECKLLLTPQQKMADVLISQLKP
jgi:hypothetical protein